MKKYSYKTIGVEHTLPIPVGDVNQYVKFVKITPSDDVAYLDVHDKKLQAAIEASGYFKRGEIKIFFATEDAADEVEPAKKKKKSSPDKDSDEGEDSNELVSYDEVTTFKEAREVFERDFDIKKTSSAINSAEKIFAKAAELGIVFPNLKAE